MSHGKRITLATAQAIAMGLEAKLGHGCEGMLPAGSVRRREPTIGDIEIVAVPRPSTLWTLGLDDILNRMVAEGQLERGEKQGPKYQQWLLPHYGRLKIDLFLADEDNWGLILALRTGPQNFSKRIVTPWEHGGKLQSGYKVEGGRLRRIDDGEVVATPDEHEFLQKWCGGWVPPSDRR